MNHSARADRKRIWHIRKNGKRGNAVCIPRLMEENRDCILPGVCYNKGELNTQNDRCLRRADRVSEGNRETGVNPVRSRHCKRRAALHNAIAKARRRGAVTTRKSGNLPVIGTGQNARVTRNWPRRSLPPFRGITKPESDLPPVGRSSFIRVRGISLSVFRSNHFCAKTQGGNTYEQEENKYLDRRCTGGGNAGRLRRRICAYSSSRGGNRGDHKGIGAGGPGSGTIRPLPMPWRN